MSRIHHPGCRVDVDERSDRETFSDPDAEAWLEPGSILVSYYDEDGMVIFDGVEAEDGGYSLSARSRPWRADLRPMADDPGVLAGMIEAPDESFAWRLRLGNAVGVEAD